DRPRDVDAAADLRPRRRRRGPGPGRSVPRPQHGDRHGARRAVRWCQRRRPTRARAWAGCCRHREGGRRTRHPVRRMSAERQRVLLIIDDIGVVWPARHSLEGAGYEVRWYGDAKAALNALDTFAPKLVIVDVMLPGGGGWTVVDTIRALPEGERPR